MPEYNIGFSEKLIDAARVVVEDGLDSVDSKRTVLYLSLLSCEITLKALLERAGKPVTEIRKYSHNLSELLGHFSWCQVQVDIANGRLMWVPAARIRSLVVDPAYGNATVGTLLEAEDCGASKYPNQIRYGDSLYHYPPEMILGAATRVMAWAKEHWDRIRVAHE